MNTFLKYGTARRVTIPKKEMDMIESLIYQRLEHFFSSKRINFNFEACGLIMLFDGSTEVHLRMKNIRRIDQSVNTDNDVIIIEPPPAPVYTISSDEEDSPISDKSTTTLETAGEVKVEAASLSTTNRNEVEMSQNDQLKAYLSYYLSVQKNSVAKQDKNDGTSTNTENSCKIKMETSQRASILATRNIETLSASPASVNSSNDDQTNQPKMKGSKRQLKLDENSFNTKKQKLQNSVTDDDKVYTCKICQEICFGRVSYFQHTQSLHGKVPCYICGSTYTQKGNMERHMNSHFGNKPFPCDVCSLSYTRLESLRNHKLNVHRHAS